MSAEALRDELLALAGVDDAEVDITDEAPSGVRVRLSANADATVVGQEVQRVLTSYGVRSRVGAPEAQNRDGPPPPPGAPGEVVAMADFETGERLPRRRRSAPEEDVTIPDAVLVTPVVTSVALEGVAVQETKDGVIVTATASDGRSSARRARWTGGGLNEAGIAAVAELSGEEAPPLVVGVNESDIAGTSVVTVLLERADGVRVAGTSIVEAGAPFALARAAWIALAAPD